MDDQVSSRQMGIAMDLELSISLTEDSQPGSPELQPKLSLVIYFPLTTIQIAISSFSSNFHMDKFFKFTVITPRNTIL